MARRRRPRVRRTVTLFALLALLVALLELNQLLPGGWPGGGGDGGFRQDLGTGSDAERLRPSTTDVTLVPPDGLRVVLRLPGGPSGAVTDWRVGTLDSETRAPDSAGVATLPAGSDLTRGFFVERPDGRRILHGPADPTRGEPWVVRVPEAGFVSRAPESGELRIRVVSRGGRQPVPGARVRAVDLVDGRDAEGTTDARGEVHFAALSGRVRVDVEAEGRRPATRRVLATDGAVAEIELPRLRELRTRFVDAEDGSLVAVERVRVLSPDGERLHEGPRGARSLVVEIEEHRLEGALVEVGGGDRPFVRVPVRDLGDALEVPRGRRFEVRATDPQGRPLPEAGLVATYVPPVLGEAAEGRREPAEVTVRARDAVVLPAGVDAHVVVAAPHSAPGVLEVSAEDESGRRSVRLEPGARLVVVVTRPGGDPIPGAEVLAVTAVGGRRVERRAFTDADGRARLRELPPGPVEVYAHAPGTVWALAPLHAVRGTGTEEEGEGRIVLAPERRLRLVVETPLGLPIEGARVRVVPEHGGKPDVLPPGSGACCTNREGTLVTAGLTDRAYRVHVSHPSHRDLIVDDVRPGPAIHFVTLQDD